MDMNGQSSRSQAIFSLTLTQKKHMGLNPLPPPRSSSPLPPGGPGRSPSCLACPRSMIAVSLNRVSSPTPGRPGTPSFSSAINRSSLQASDLRPPSSLSFHHPDHEQTDPGAQELCSEVDGEGIFHRDKLPSFISPLVSPHNIFFRLMSGILKCS